MGYYSTVDLSLEIIVSGLIGLVSGLFLNVVTAALASIVPDYAWTVGLLLLVIVSLIGAFSDAEEMMARGVFYCLAVMLVSVFVFGDIIEASLAIGAALLSLGISWYKSQDSGG